MEMQGQLGLALGGGGVRGGAHIGLLKVLDREGIKVGPIAGTSAGGIVGGLYAAGLSAVKIERLLLSCAPETLLEPDSSGWSLLSAHRFIELIRRRLGDPHIEDLPHPFAAVAVDLRSGRQVFLTSGPLAVAVQATMALPGLLCPVDDGECLLADGGVLDNVPIDAARQLGAARVLAVDVGMPADAPLEAASFGLPPGKVPRLIERVLILTKRDRAAMAAARALGILSAEISAYRLRDYPPDLMLRPDLGTINIMDLRRLAEAIAIGEQMAEAHLDEIRQLAGQTSEVSEK